MSALSLKEYVSCLRCWPLPFAQLQEPPRANHPPEAASVLQLPSGPDVPDLGSGGKCLSLSLGSSKVAQVTHRPPPWGTHGARSAGDTLAVILQNRLSHRDGSQPPASFSPVLSRTVYSSRLSPRLSIDTSPTAPSLLLGTPLVTHKSSLPPHTLRSPSDSLVYFFFTVCITTNVILCVYFPGHSLSVSSTRMSIPSLCLSHRYTQSPKQHHAQSRCAVVVMQTRESILHSLFQVSPWFLPRLTPGSPLGTLVLQLSRGERPHAQTFRARRSRPALGPLSADSRLWPP